MTLCRLLRCNPSLNITELGEELILLDPESGQSHMLSAGAAGVWRAVRDGDDGWLLDEALVPVIDGLLALGVLLPSGSSPRTVLRTSALSAAALAAVGIVSIALPSAAAQQIQ